MEPVTAIATSVAAGSMALDTIGGLFGWGGGSSEQGITLPPALEFRMLNDSIRDFQRIEQDYARAQQLTQHYEQKFNKLSEMMLAGVPPDNIRREMATQTAQLATQLGMPVGDAIKNGFMSQEDLDDMAQLKELESEDFTDPRYEQERAQQQQRLMADLQRRGASPAVIQQALTDFENTSVMGRFTRSEELREHRAGMISGRMGLRQNTQKMWFDMGSSAINTQMNVQTGWGNQLANAGAMSQSAYQAGVAGIGINQQLRGEAQGKYDALGQYKLSGAAKGYMKQDPFTTGRVNSYSGYQAQQASAPKYNPFNNRGSEAEFVAKNEKLYAQSQAASAAEKKRIG